MAAPMSLKVMATAASLLEILWAVCLVQVLICSACDQFEGFLLCRKCGFEVVKAQDIFSMPSKLAQGVRNDTITKDQRVLIQLFKNPNGHFFEVITARAADAETDNVNFATDSWFPGYVWSVAKCPRCGTHIGWFFTAAKAAFDRAESQVLSFVGIILGKVMHEDEVQSLIISPKLYHS